MVVVVHKTVSGAEPAEALGDLVEHREKHNPILIVPVDRPAVVCIKIANVKKIIEEIKMVPAVFYSFETTPLAKYSSCIISSQSSFSLYVPGPLLFLFSLSSASSLLARVLSQE